MDMDFSAEDIAFREEVRAFLKDNLPDRLRDGARQARERAATIASFYAPRPREDSLRRALLYALLERRGLTGK